MSKLFVRVENVTDLTDMAVDYFSPQKTHEQKSTHTNGDRIRAMSDEGLADLLRHIRGGCKGATIGDYHCRFMDNFEADCERCWLEWLKEEDSNG